jgi:hypothetical protein
MRRLGEHRRLLRGAFARHDGVEVGTEGDSFFIAFPTAPGAVAAAAGACQALAATPIRVRIGIHTGTPHVVDGQYLGLDVHRAARIAAAAHGGQVALSAATAALVGGEGLRDLGEHRLKDLAAPERIFQLGEGEFPALRSLYGTNLPVPPTPFLGRETELAAVVALLRSTDARLVTLTGPGGTGKTRLALQAAAEAVDEFPDGVVWVSLAPVADVVRVPATVAQAMAVEEEPGVPLVDTLVDRLRGKRRLLLLDNAEHLVAGVAELVARILDVGGPRPSSSRAANASGCAARPLGRCPRSTGETALRSSSRAPARSPRSSARRPQSQSCASAWTTFRLHWSWRPRGSCSSRRNSCSTGWESGSIS